MANSLLGGAPILSGRLTRGQEESSRSSHAPALRAQRRAAAAHRSRWPRRGRSSRVDGSSEERPRTPAASRRSQAAASRPSHSAATSRLCSPRRTTPSRAPISVVSERHGGRGTGRPGSDSLVSTRCRAQSESASSATLRTSASIMACPCSRCSRAAWSGSTAKRAASAATASSTGSASASGVAKRGSADASSTSRQRAKTGKIWRGGAEHVDPAPVGQTKGDVVQGVEGARPRIAGELGRSVLVHVEERLGSEVL